MMQQQMGLRVAVTGANGFVGRDLMQALDRLHIPTVGLIRKKTDLSIPQHGTIQVVQSLKDADFSGCTHVVHLAAKVHQLQQTDPASYLSENVTVTEQVIEAAAKAGVKCFVFMSTIKVYGEFEKTPFTTQSPRNPISPYGKSKLAAEEAARVLCEKYQMRLDIIRIPLVVGRRAKGNLGTVKKLMQLGVPLPLGGVRNLRSFVKLETLSKFIAELVMRSFTDNTGPSQWVHHVCEQEPVSSGALLQHFAEAQGGRVKLISVPQVFLHLACWCLDWLRGQRRDVGSRTSDKLLGDAVLVQGSLRLK